MVSGLTKDFRSRMFVVSMLLCSAILDCERNKGEFCCQHWPPD